jgi:Putative zinc-finger
MRWRTSSGEDHRQTQALLPWYVTGQLEAEQIRRIEAHLEACDACRAELAAERRLREAIVSAPVEEGRERASPRRRAVLAAGAFGALGAIAASLAAVSVANLPPPHAPAGRDMYRTLGDPPSPGAGQVVVVFDPACTEGEMSAALARAQARIADGPTTAGAYILRVPHGKREAALAALRASPGVRLAQSLGGPG